MVYHNFLSGSLFFLLVVFCSSCSTSTSPWRITSVEDVTPSYRSKRLVYADKNVRFELYKTAHEIAGYLCVTSLPIPPIADDESNSEIALFIDEQKELLIAHRFAGGQKVVLTENVLQKALHAWNQQKTITFKTGRYSLTITPPPEKELRTIIY